MVALFGEYWKKQSSLPESRKEAQQEILTSSGHYIAANNVYKVSMSFIHDTEFEGKFMELRDRLLKIEHNPGEANRLKEEGNELFKKGKYEEAAEKYTAAMGFALDPAIYCNRAAAFVPLGKTATFQNRGKDYHKALRDCRAALSLSPDYAKAYFRMGATFTGLGYYEFAVEAYYRPSRWTRHSSCTRTN